MTTQNSLYVFNKDRIIFLKIPNLLLIERTDAIEE